ncbi:MAG: hypothetical protein KIH69_013610 [Anaerolineae bacterium]|nr:hypothetical protein [Anaerolineae bacterium]
MKTNKIKNLTCSILASTMAFALSANVSLAAAPAAPEADWIDINPNALDFTCVPPQPLEGMPKNSWMFFINFGKSYGKDTPDACLLTWNQQWAAPPTYTKIKCTNVNNVVIQNGKGFFNGTNHIECPFNLKQYLPELPNEVFYKRFEMSAKIDALSEVKMAKDKFEHPIVKHDSFGLSTEWIGEPNANVKLNMTSLHRTNVDGSGLTYLESTYRQGQVADIGAGYPYIVTSKYATHFWGYNDSNEDQRIQHYRGIGPNKSEVGNALAAPFMYMKTAPNTIRIGNAGSRYLVGALDYVVVTHYDVWP